jgi:excisionase family DNA binding protein
MSNDLLTPARAAALLGVSRRRVAEFIASGRLPAVNLGGEGRGARYVLRREDVERFAAETRKPGPPRKTAE